MNLLPMTAADLEDVAALEARVHAFPWTPGHFRDSLLAGHSGWVVREDGHLLCFALVMCAVDEAHLLDIAVAPTHQRQGRGAALLDGVCARARAAGMGRMLLEVRSSNESAIAFYRRCDFLPIGCRRGYYPGLAGREDALVMARNL